MFESREFSRLDDDCNVVAPLSSRGAFNLALGHVPGQPQEARQLVVGFLPGEAVRHVAGAAAAEDDRLAAQRGNAADGGLQIVLHPRPRHVRPGESDLSRHEDVEDRCGQRRAVERRADGIEIRVQRGQGAHCRLDEIEAGRMRDLRIGNR